MFVVADKRIALSKVILLFCQGKMEKPYIESAAPRPRTTSASVPLAHELAL